MWDIHAAEPEGVRFWQKTPGVQRATLLPQRRRLLDAECSLQATLWGALFFDA
jgi:hypothetical protein